jgi:SNF2 family DNA or RNA helicase
MGLGKTLISLSWVAAHSKRVLVVCPKVVRRTWVQEAHRFFPGYFKGVELRPDRLRKEGMPDLSGYNLATVNFASFEKFLPAIAKSGFDTLIIDESHYIKNEKAQITRAIYSVKKLFAHKILLSGNGHQK